MHSILQLSFQGINRTLQPLPVPDHTIFPLLDQETYHDARTVAPSYDVYWLETEWRNFWVDSGKP